MISQLNPSDFSAWRENATAGAVAGTLPVLIDVREPWELQTASVKAEGFTLLHIPMREIPARVAELQDTLGSGQPIACLCHHGMRSLQVANYLAQSGFSEVVNLQGGIDAWSRQVDPSVPLY
ncbi:Rhodanese-related sulfurtransferase [Polaromonas sp. OV174]|uniref:rhodanese-like domain-containing protein n=1 Tax=Polaromonas sp. OV174 TaxID=1855300 RepID=UPI0008EA87F9|nr:rhodanese-like domain-containing protein [Polaromonas sp. OV174]SFC46468.1 Rhodanese-related sulfurtransferase [Polaromonas sp. OV174]